MSFYRWKVSVDEASQNIKEWRRYCQLSQSTCASYIGIALNTYRYKEKSPNLFTFEEQLKLVNCISNRCREMGVANQVTWHRVFNNGCALCRESKKNESKRSIY